MLFNTQTSTSTNSSSASQLADKAENNSSETLLLTPFTDLEDKDICRFGQCSFNEQEQLAFSTKRPLFKARNCWIVGLFALLNVSALALIWFSVHSKNPIAPVNSIFPQVSEEVALQPTVITPLPIFETLFGPESSAAWSAELPLGDGFIIVDEPDHYGLPPGVTYSKGYNKYGVTWTHQYHCLQMLHKEFSSIVRNESDTIGGDIDSPPVRHLFHCIDYLRQTTMCNMDTTIEWPTGHGHDNKAHVNGYNITHQCKPKEMIVDFMNKHHAPD